MQNNLKIKQILFQVPPDYYFRLNFFQKLWHNRKWHVIKNMIKKFRLKPNNILEIGCAGGYLSNHLAGLFRSAKVTGIDLYHPAIFEAQKRYPGIKFIKADAHKLPFADNSFDLIICSETIEHLVYPHKALGEIIRVLAPHGISIIEMDSGNWLFKFIWFFWVNFSRGRVWKNAHLHNLNTKILEKMINASGLKTLEKKYSHFGMAVTFLLNKQ